MPDSVWPHRRQPTRLPGPWDSPGKNAGVGCHFLLQYMKMKSESEVTQSCLTLSDPMDCSLPGSSVHGLSRQEHWSGLPFPSPRKEHCKNILKNTSMKNTSKWKVSIKTVTYILWYGMWWAKEQLVQISLGRRMIHLYPGKRRHVIKYSESEVLVWVPECNFWHDFLKKYKLKITCQGEGEVGQGREKPE